MIYTTITYKYYQYIYADTMILKQGNALMLIKHEIIIDIDPKWNILFR